VFAGHDRPHRLAHVVAEADAPVGRLVGQEDAPPVVGHADVVELRPALGVDAHGRAQPHVLLLEAGRTHVLPPVDVVGQPLLERAQQLLVVAQGDVVGNLGLQVNR